jgi:hypothetical protein
MERALLDHADGPPACANEWVRGGIPKTMRSMAGTKASTERELRDALEKAQREGQQWKREAQTLGAEVELF